MEARKPSRPIVAEVLNYRGLAALLGLLLLACAGQAGPPARISPLPVSAPGGLPAAALPPPSTFASAPAPRNSSYSDDDLLKGGSDSDPSLPHNSTTVNGLVTAFSPQGQGGLTPIGNCAYCGYRFTAPGYDRGGLVRLAFGASAPESGETWVGLSNWAGQRWDWFKASDSGGGVLRASTPGLEPYFNASSELLIMVLLTGPSDAALSTVRIGGIAPVALLQASPAAGVPPLSVDFDAGASTAGEGSLVEFRWDWNGDGLTDASGSSPTAHHDYSVEGVYDAAVTVVNSAEESSEAVQQVRVIDYWTHSYGLGELDSLADVAVGADGRIYICGGLSDPGVIDSQDEVVAALTPFGEPLWATRYSLGPTSASSALRINLDAASGLTVLAYQENAATGRDIVLQQWSTAGQLLSSYSYGTPDDDLPLDMLMDGSDIYVCGSVHYQGNNHEAMLLKVPGLGNSGSMRLLDFSSDSDSLSSMVFTRDGVLAINGIAAFGTLVEGAASYPCLELFDLGLAITDTRLLDLDSNASGGALYYTRGLLEAGYFYAAGTYDASGTNNVYFLKLPAAAGGSSIFGSRAALPANSSLRLSRIAQGDFVVSGWNYTELTANLARFSAADGQLASAESMQAGGALVVLSGQLPYNGGRLVWGVAPDAASPQFLDAGASSQGLTSQWTDKAGGSTASLPLPALNSNGSVSSALAQLVSDSGAGLGDLYVSYGPQP